MSEQKHLSPDVWHQSRAQRMAALSEAMGALVDGLPKMAELAKLADNDPYANQNWAAARISAIAELGTAILQVHAEMCPVPEQAPNPSEPRGNLLD